MSRISRALVAFAVVIMLLGAAAGLVAADRILARSDRIAAAARANEMLSVRDQLLRFEMEHGRLPASLEELVSPYVREDQIASDGGPLYSYDPEGRVLAQAEGSRVRGIMTRRLDPVVMRLPVPDRPTEPPSPPEEATFIAPEGMALPEPPAGAFVFEAEHYTDTNYGWEVHPDESCSGGAYCHSKEGIGNGPGQLRGVGDFYNVGDVREISRLRYHFRLSRAGSYYVYGRMWTTDTHCSNWLHVAIDKGGPKIGGMGNRTPFRWRWSRMDKSPVALSAGDHFLHVFIHEDGIRIDQFILAPVEIGGSAAYRANMLPGRGTAWKAHEGPPVHLSFDLGGVVLSPEEPPECRLAVRRLRPAEGKAGVRVILRHAAEDGSGVSLAENEIALADAPELCFMPVDFGKLDIEKLPRREYLLAAELTLAGETVAATHVPLMRPYAWEASDVVQYLPNERKGPLDGDATRDRAWHPFADASFTWFGVLDFGVHSIGNSLHAPQHKTIYVRTRVHVPVPGSYLFKIQSDDQIILWLDGKEICRHDECAWRPVTRTAISLAVELSAGEHRIRMRVNQVEGRWQACLRIRTKDDRLSDVTGLPPQKR